MNPRAFFLMAAYFGGIGYFVGKKNIDVKVMRAVKILYTDAVAYTKSVPPYPMSIGAKGRETERI